MDSLLTTKQRTLSNILYSYLYSIQGFLQPNSLNVDWASLVKEQWPHAGLLSISNQRTTHIFGINQKFKMPQSQGCRVRWTRFYLFPTSSACSLAPSSLSGSKYSLNLRTLWTCVIGLICLAGVLFASDGPASCSSTKRKHIKARGKTSDRLIYSKTMYLLQPLIPDHW